MTDIRKNKIEAKGIGHVLAAFGYSMAGLGVLLREEAAKLEVVLLIVIAIAFFFAGAAFQDYVILIALFFALLCIEAINTAIELIVDRTSPERSEYGKQAKDLGSFAVFCGLAVFCLYGLSVVAAAIFS